MLFKGFALVRLIRTINEDSKCDIGTAAFSYEVIEWPKVGKKRHIILKTAEVDKLYSPKLRMRSETTMARVNRGDVEWLVTESQDFELLVKEWEKLDEQQ